MKKPILVKKLEAKTLPSEGTVSFEGALVEDQDATGAEFDELRLEQCEMQDMIFNETSTEETMLVDCIIKRSCFAGAKLKEPFLARVEFVSCRLQGVQADVCVIRDTYFRSSKIQSGNFRYGKLKDVVFEDCDLLDADFVGTQLECVTFNKCNLNGVDFSQAQLKDVRLGGSTIESIRIASDSLKKVTVDTSQALYLASIFGLNIED